jgi:hypothetical protein
MNSERGFWLTWSYAVSLVERHRGVSWGKAAKAVDDAIANGKLRWEHRSSPDETVKGPAVWEADLMRLLDPKNWGGKQSRIRKLLGEMFQNKRVPDRSDCPRNALKADLLKRDPSLKPLNLTTLKTAIDTYNNGRS